VIGGTTLNGESVAAVRFDAFKGKDAGKIAVVAWSGLLKLQDSTDHDPSEKVVMLNELMLESDHFKDVKFRLSDGEESAHKSVLAVASEVFSAMLLGQMKESHIGTIDLPDVNCATMRVFLRQLYTRHVQPKDWGGLDGDLVPLHILVGSVSLARKYLVNDVLEDGIEALKGRIKFIDVVVFDEILSAAIALDLQPLRHVALETAKGSASVRNHYNACGFRPEVQFELTGLWPPPPTTRQTRKRARIA
jgi:hypothetical protein